MPLDPDEIDDLKSMLKVARKKPLNFALCLESKPEETVLLLNRRKDPAILLRRAKALGNSPKLTMGQLRMEGKVVILDCEVEAPPNCARQLRLFLRSIGTSVQVRVRDPKGEQDGLLKADDDPDPVAIVPTPFKKAQALWAMTNNKMDKEITRLQSAIIDTCGPDPTLKSIVDEVADLPARLDVFEDELDDRLDDLVSANANKEASLDALKAQARATVQEYETTLNSAFFAELDTKNGFLKVAVTSSAKQALTAISKVLV